MTVTHGACKKKQSKVNIMTKRVIGPIVALSLILVVASAIVPATKISAKDDAFKVHSELTWK